MAKRIKKTLAMRVLEGQGVDYDVVTFPEKIHEAADIAAHSDKLTADMIFKTLVAETDDSAAKKLLVMVPSTCQLVPKKLAAAIGVGRTKMVRHEDAEKLTGLQTGGIGALALLNRGFAIYIDQRANAHEHIAVSAGKRGINVIVSTTALIEITEAGVVDVAEEMT